MKFEQLKVIEVNVKNGKMLSIQIDAGQEDCPDLAMAGMWEPTGVGYEYAQLFAAAPDLLEALEELIQAYDFQMKSYEQGEVSIKAHVAIAKAKGK